MKKLLLSTALIVGLSGAHMTGAQAQTISIDAVVAACASAGATVDGCLAAQNAYIAALEAQGLAPAEIDAAIGTLVVQLAESAAANPAVIATAIAAAATAVSDPAQAAAINEVATAVETGEPVSTTVVAQAASPN